MVYDYYYYYYWFESNTEMKKTNGDCYYKRYENLVIILQFQNVSFTILKKKILNMLIYNRSLF